MKKYLAFLVIAAMLQAGPAAADAISYGFFELGYLETEVDRQGVDDDGDGYELNLSARVTPAVALVFSHQDIELDNDSEVTLSSLGIAYHKPYSNSGDTVLGLAYLKSEVDSDDEDGNEISLEVRSRTSPQTEVHLGFLRREIDDKADSGYLFRIVSGNPQGFQFVIDYEDLDDTGSLALGLRSTF